MRHSPPVQKSTPAQRKARVAAVVAKAEAKGEKVPRGVKLIGFQDLPQAAHDRAASLVPMARKILARRKAAA